MASCKRPCSNCRRRRGWIRFGDTALVLDLAFVPSISGLIVSSTVEELTFVNSFPSFDLGFEFGDIGSSSHDQDIAMSTLGDIKQGRAGKRVVVELCVVVG